MNHKGLDVLDNHCLRHSVGDVFPLAGFLSISRSCDDSHDSDDKNLLGVALRGQVDRGDGGPGKVDEDVEDAQVHGHANGELARRRFENLHKGDLLGRENHAGQVFSQGQNSLTGCRRQLLDLLGLARQVFQQLEGGFYVHLCGLDLEGSVC